MSVAKKFLLDFITHEGRSRWGSSCLLHTNRDFLKTDILFCQRRKWSLRRIQSGKKKSSGRANMPSALRIHVLKEVSDNIGQV